MPDFFKQLAATAAGTERIVQTMGVPYSDPFNEEATIADVNDPKLLGRVKVTTDDGLTSNWVPVSGSNSGTLSARYIGARVLIGKRNGRSENMYVIGVIRTDPDVGITGSPLQLPIIDESTAIWNDTSDRGMRCNEGNEGRMYILSNEMNQDVVVCLRRTSPQVGSEPAWAWKSITNGIWIEKGVNPGNETTVPITQGQERNPGIPACTESMLGEVHEFAEDRGFRTTSMVCRRDENGEFGWMPLSAPPTFFRTTLPTCTEKVHGMEAIVDDGSNSEFMVCQRYQGLMRWVRHGQRIPQRFYGKDNPLDRISFTTGYKSIPALEEQPQDFPGYSWAGIPDIRQAVFDSVISQIPLTGTDPTLRRLLENAGRIPAQSFTGAQTLSAAAKEALLRRTGVPVETLTRTIREELDRQGVLEPATAQLLVGTGSAVQVLIEGVRQGTVEDALLDIGQNTIRNALFSLNPQAAGVMTGLMSGGVWGAVDSAVALNLDRIPPEVNRYVQPVVEVAKEVLSGYPTALGDVLNAAVSGGLKDAVSGSLNSLIGSNIVSPGLIDSVSELLSGGGLGPVSEVFSSFSNLQEILKAPGDLASLPLLASTAMGALGIDSAVTGLLGSGGIGLSAISDLFGEGFNPVSSLLGGVPGLSKLFGGFGGSSGCPCDPSCRKTGHGEDSDGNNLLNPCGSLTGNNANAYREPSINNTGPVAQYVGTEPTFIGNPLLPKNPINLTGSINEIERMGNMAKRFYDARYADLPELLLELAYTFESSEKGFKVADNNITQIESIQRKLIDALYRILRNILMRIAPAESLAILRGYVIPADREWRQMEPGDSRFTPRGIGQINPRIPSPSDREFTIFDRNKVINESLLSKLSQDNGPVENNLIDNLLSPNQIDTLKSTVTPKSLRDPQTGQPRRELAPLSQALPSAQPLPLSTRETVAPFEDDLSPTLPVRDSILEASEEVLSQDLEKLEEIVSRLSEFIDPETGFFTPEASSNLKELVPTLYDEIVERQEEPDEVDCP